MAARRTSDSSASCSKGCGRAPRRGRGRCAVCREKRSAASRRDYQYRALRGQCVYCKDSASVGLFCFTHWLKNLGVAHGLGNKKGIAILRALWDEQGGRCAVTGEVLIPGSTASIDHAIPKSRGGSSDKSNLRWVLLNINRIKWDMTHDEFVATCRKVIRAQDRLDVEKVLVETLHTRSN